MAGVRRLGVVTSAAPVGPGVHWKAPLLDSVDRLQISLATFRADDLQVYTIDNQTVRIGIGLSYRVPAAAVFRLLHNVGGTGNVDIDSSLRPIVADRALRVSARRNTVSISAERESIATEIRRSIQDSVPATFGIEVVDLQLSRIEYSGTFTQGVKAAVRAKNDALQAESTVARIRFDGEQTKVQASAQAEAAATRAEGEARAAVVRSCRKRGRRAARGRRGGGCGAGGLRNCPALGRQAARDHAARRVGADAVAARRAEARAAPGHSRRSTMSVIKVDRPPATKSRFRAASSYSCSTQCRNGTRPSASRA